jgi:fermentation-respiration switch protein FrsA (DUF1100 family)
VTRAVLALAAVLVLVTTLAWNFQRRLVYFPSTGQVPAAAQVLGSGQDVELTTSDGLRLGAWFTPATDPDAVAVLVANGNGGDRSDRAPLARALAGRGLAVLLFDYRGYGGNPGSPTEEGLARDVRAAWRYLLEEAEFPPERVLYLGESLGAAVVTELAVEHPPGGLVLRSPFVDLASVGRTHYPLLPVGVLLRDRYPLTGHLARVRSPVTVVYGTADSIVPPEQSHAVADAAPHLVQVVPVPGADHNDAELLDGRALVGAVVDLADRARAG